MARDRADGEPRQDAAQRIRRCFDRLEGVWRLDRRILDRPWNAAQTTEHDAEREAGYGAGGEVQRQAANAPAAAPAMRARLHGEARFRRLEEDVLAYAEEGTLTLANGARVRAVRHYVYRLDGAALLVEFADGPDAGRRYLRFAAAGDAGHPVAGRDDGSATGADWHAADQHLCGRDLYEAVYRFRGFDADDAMRRMVQRTTVTGPRKAYAIVTLLRPRPPA